ncbi:MAG: MC/SLC25 family protein [archaeon]|nr:MC/SLC25 family protein [archaeon]
MSRWVQSALSGVASGFLSVLTLYPLDIVRTRLQVQHVIKGKTHTSSLIQTTTELYRQRGVRGFYQGLSTNLVGSSVAWGLYFAAFHGFQRRLSRHLDRNDDETSHRADLPPLLNLVCGVGAGVLATTVTTPIWIVKTRIQVGDLQRGSVRYSGLLHGLRSIWGQEGLPGLTRGLVPALWSTSHTAIQFMVYEELLKTFGADSSASVLLCAAASKTVASALTNPFQVIKARIQIHSPGQQAADATPFSTSFLATARQAFRHEGVAGFYRGWTLALARTVPGSAFTLLLFEHFQRLSRFS